jgi:hypothetical protein
MSKQTAIKTTANKLTPSSIAKRLTEVLMVKTGIKAGPEFTGGH